MVKKKVCFLFAAILAAIIFNVSCHASEKSEFQAWLAAFKVEALAAGISQATLDSALGRAKYLDLVIRLDRNQPEFKLSLDDYLARTLSETRVAKGRDKLRQNAKVLAQVEKSYGVPAHLLVAFWGIETDYGRVTGSFPVIEALATLTFDLRRRDFFKKELMASLRLVDAGYLSPREMEGSWAGAMGYLQFLPSVFEKYKIDFDNDGRIEIWNNHGDLFSTAANYLSKSGWQPGWRWGREVSVSATVSEKMMGLAEQKKISEWQTLGVRSLDGDDLPKADVLASLIRPDSKKERFFLVYDNFRVIMKWNRSTYYALAVGLLADSLKESISEQN